MSKTPAPSKAARELKRLREAAGITMPEAAEATGYKGRPSSYQHYEDRTKKEALPLDLIRGIARLFESRGIDSGPLWPLAGIAAGSADGELIHKKKQLSPGAINKSSTSIGQDDEALVEEETMLMKKTINILGTLNGEHLLDVYAAAVRAQAKQEEEEKVASRPTQQRA